MKNWHKLNRKLARQNYLRNCRMDWYGCKREWVVELLLRYPFVVVRRLHDFFGWILKRCRHPKCEGCNDSGYSSFWPFPEAGIDCLSPDFDENDPRMYCDCVAGLAVKDALDYRKKQDELRSNNLQDSHEGTSEGG